MVLTLVFVSTAFAYDITIGNDAISRSVVDSYQNFSIVDTNNPAASDGVLVQFEYWASNTNPFKFLVLDAGKMVMWKSELITPTSTGVNIYNLATAVPVETGWNVGFWFQNSGTIPFNYDGTADPAYYTPNNNGEPAKGSTLSEAGTTDRFYSFVAYGWFGDTDGDGVGNGMDLCPDTEVDTGNWERDWGTNRWQVMEVEEVLGWYQNKPIGKGETEATYAYDLSYTYGCNGHQILDILQIDLGDAMNGHRKFGLSSSVLEEFHTNLSDGNVSGRWYIETVTVPANQSTPKDSLYPLLNGVNYLFNARGTATACWQSGCHITFDAEYSTSDYPSFLTWVDGVAAPYTSYGTDLLDLRVNGDYVDWGTYNPLHTYELPSVGVGDKVNFGIYDITGSYSNDAGNLYVDIIANL